ncbi:MAG: hypothetical protein ACFFB3_12325 [Candidatus Hodarchaeota archaeon]
MGKKDQHKSDLTPLFAQFAATDTEGKITEYLLSNSNLPGRRANLELANAFAETVAEQSSFQESEDLWQFCHLLTKISIEEAPVNDPKEFLPFCGTCGLGAIGATHPELFSRTLDHLRSLATDKRWRMREAVRIGLMRLFATDLSVLQAELERWVEEENWSVLRAVATSTGEQCLEMGEEFALWALEIHKRILNKIIASSERSSEEFKALRKGLAYTLSVVVHSTPIEGFDYLHQLAEKQDRDITWIVRQNLSKKRLTKNHPKEVKALEKKL